MAEVTPKKEGPTSVPKTPGSAEKVQEGKELAKEVGNLGLHTGALPMLVV
jgi:hypothetical protein